MRARSAEGISCLFIGRKRPAQLFSYFLQERPAQFETKNKIRQRVELICFFFPTIFFYYLLSVWEREAREGFGKNKIGQGRKFAGKPTF